jgi:hypothetical protein
MSLLVVAGEAAAVAPAPILALTEGVMKAMLLTKLKLGAASLLVGCAVLLTTAAGWQANSAGAADPPTSGEPPRKVARDPDKDRIAQLERECELLRREIAVLRERLALAEARPMATDGVSDYLEPRKRIEAERAGLDNASQRLGEAREDAIRALAKCQEDLKKSPNSAEAKPRLENAQREVDQITLELKTLIQKITENAILANELEKKADEDAAQRQAIKGRVLAQATLKSLSFSPPHLIRRQPPPPATPAETVGEKLLAALKLRYARQQDLKKSPDSAEAKQRLEEAQQEVERLRQLVDPATRQAADDLRSAMDALRGPVGFRDANAEVRQADLKVTRAYLAALDRYLKVSPPTAPTSPISPSKPGGPVTVKPADLAATEAKTQELDRLIRESDDRAEELQRQLKAALRGVEESRRAGSGMPPAAPDPDPNAKPASPVPVVPPASKPADPRSDPFAPAAGAPAKPVVRIYRLDGLATNEKEAEAMIKVIRATVAPKSWGVEAEAEYFAPTNGIVVRQTPEAHKEIEDLIKMIRPKTGQGK